MDVAQISHKDVIYTRDKTNGKDNSTSTTSYKTTSKISDISKNLIQSNINLSNSEIDSSGESVNFNLKFLKDAEEKFSLNGYCAKDYTKGEFSFNYDYRMGDRKDSKSAVKYKVEFSLSFNSMSSVSIQFGEEKEDIFDFLRRITREIFKKINEGKTNISAFVLDFEDMKDINAIGDKKLVQLIYHLIEMIKVAIEAKKMTNKHSLGHSVVYNPHRIINNTFQTVINAGISVNCSFSANEIKGQKPTVQQ